VTFSGKYHHHFGLLTIVEECSLNAIVAQPKNCHSGCMLELKKYDKMSLLADAPFILLGFSLVSV
jgi:hypothetical protein